MSCQNGFSPPRFSSLWIILPFSLIENFQQQDFQLRKDDPKSHPSDSWGGLRSQNPNPVPKPNFDPKTDPKDPKNSHIWNTFKTGKKPKNKNKGHRNLVLNKDDIEKPVKVPNSVSPGDEITIHSGKKFRHLKRPGFGGHNHGDRLGLFDSFKF